MAPSIELTREVPPDTEAVGVAVSSDHLTESGLPLEFLSAQGFEAKRGEVAVVPVSDGPDLVALGVGPTSQVDVPAIRRAAAVLARSTSRRRFVASRLLEPIIEPAMRVAAAQAHAEATSLACYRFDTYKSDPKPVRLERVAIVGTGGKRVQAALDLGVRVADGVGLARDLVNEPGGSLTPRRLAEVAVEVAQREDLRVSVLDEHDIVEARLGGLLGVNRGSTEPPRFVQICYEPASPRGSLALVGKGITFDSGGLSLKPADSMATMKDDMGGAAAIIGAFSAIRAVAPRCRVVGYVPMTDNMGGGDATRPGDVLCIRNGKTVEVLNTDAEGRLILADALSLASEDNPDAIVDIATLTGAVGVALGNRIAGLMGNNDSWVTQVRDAADRAGERVWQLPLPDDYRPRIDSDVADLRNIAKTRDAGTITAAMFLREFVAEGIAWAHLDIASTAWWGDADEGELSRGGTGFGVRLLLELARTFRKPR